MDASVLCFALVITLLSGVGPGLLSMAGAMSKHLLRTLQETSRSHGGQSKALLRKILLAGEVGLTVILLISAGLLLKSYEKLRSSDLGCATQNIMTMRVTLPKSRYADPTTRVAFFEQVMTGVRNLPGVEAAGMGMAVPGTGYIGDDSFTIIEHPPLPPGQGQVAIRRAADPDYFRALAIPLLRGRTFNDAERLDRATSVIISDALAKRFFPGEDPLGKHLRSNSAGRDATYEIVGVVGDTRYLLDRPIKPMMYFPFYVGAFGRATIVMRSKEDPTNLALPVQKLISQIDPDLPVSDVLTMDQIIGNGTLNASFDAHLVLAFAGLSLLLAAIGLYGVLSYLVVQRTGEIGIRVALGAQRGEVLRLMLLDGLRPAAFGLLVGLVAGMGAARLIRTLLYGVKPLDGSVYLLVAAMLALTAASACLHPAWRASRLNAIDALRAD